MRIPVEDRFSKDNWSGPFLRINVISSNYIGEGGASYWPNGNTLIKKKDVRMVTDDYGTVRVYTEEFELSTCDHFDEIEAKLNFEREIDE